MPHHAIPGVGLSRTLVLIMSDTLFARSVRGSIPLSALAKDVGVFCAYMGWFGMVWNFTVRKLEILNCGTGALQYVFIISPRFRYLNTI